MTSKIKPGVFDQLLNPDVYGKLVHEANAARFNGTTPEQAEASRLTLLGKLPPLPPYVALMTETPWAEVVQVAISPEGKIAVLGIEPDGRKEIVEWKVIDRRWTCRVVDGTDANFHVDHLHYPQDSEDVAFTVTRPDGKTRVFWGDWHFDVSKTTGTVVGLYCDRVHGVDYCTVTYSLETRVYITQFRKEGEAAVTATFRSEEGTVWKGLEVLGRTTKGQLIILTTLGDSRQCIYLVYLQTGYIWRSVNDYDGILKDSIMERNGELSFVALAPEHEPSKEVLFVTPSSEKMLCALVDPNEIHCLPSGRILIQEHEDGRVLGLGNEEAVVRAPSKLFLRDVVTNERIELTGVKEIGEIVEIPSGLVVHDGFILRVVLEHQEGNPIYSQILITLDERVLELRRWEDHLVFGMGKTDKSQFGIVSVQELERWLVEGGDDQPATDVFPLYTSFDRLVPTEEGILGWHFVNGTFYIFRYPL